MVTKTISERTVPSRNLPRVSAGCPVILATRASSAMKGSTRAAANGQPRVAPIPNHMMPCAVRIPPFQFINAAVPSIVVYMANVEGRYAVDAWNMPGLVTEMMRNMIAILGFIDRETTENSFV